jgi:hypothetical protein
MESTGRESAAKLAAIQQHTGQRTSADANQKQVQKILEGRNNGPTKRK